jgi:hypothetical protein
LQRNSCIDDWGIGSLKIDPIIEDWGLKIESVLVALTGDGIGVGMN